jgi:UPF0716 protein FxsA
MNLFLLFAGFTFLEVYLLIKVNGMIGFWYTVAIIFGTAWVGSNLVRQQGLKVLARAREDMQKGLVPANAMVDGLCLLLAGALLITPGLVTDGVGFLLLFPVTRIFFKHSMMRRAQLWMQKNATAHSYTYTNFGQRPDFDGAAPDSDQDSETWQGKGNIQVDPYTNQPRYADDDPDVIDVTPEDS